MSNNKLHELVGEALNDGFTNPTLIARSIRVHHKMRVSSDEVENLLQSEYYDEIELKRFEERFRGFDGEIYF